VNFFLRDGKLSHKIFELGETLRVKLVKNNVGDFDYGRWSPTVHEELVKDIEYFLAQSYIATRTITSAKEIDRLHDLMLLLNENMRVTIKLKDEYYGTKN
jgi:hypothetical protein